MVYLVDPELALRLVYEIERGVGLHDVWGSTEDWNALVRVGWSREV